MKRRSFFATLFGGLLCRFLPKQNLLPCSYCGAWHRADQYINPKRVDLLDLSQWGKITHAENVRFDGCVVRAIDPTKPHSFTISYVTKNAYVTAPSPVVELGSWKNLKRTIYPGIKS